MANFDLCKDGHQLFSPVQRKTVRTANGPFLQNDSFACSKSWSRARQESEVSEPLFRISRKGLDLVLWSGLCPSSHKVSDHGISRPSWTLGVRTFLESWRESAWAHVSLLDLSIFPSPDSDFWSKKVRTLSSLLLRLQAELGSGPNLKVGQLGLLYPIPKFQLLKSKISKFQSLELDQV